MNTQTHAESAVCSSFDTRLSCYYVVCDTLLPKKTTGATRTASDPATQASRRVNLRRSNFCQKPLPAARSPVAIEIGIARTERNRKKRTKTGTDKKKA